MSYFPFLLYLEKSYDSLILIAHKNIRMLPFHLFLATVIR